MASESHQIGHSCCDWFIENRRAFRAMREAGNDLAAVLEIYSDDEGDVEAREHAQAMLERWRATCRARTGSGQPDDGGRGVMKRIDTRWVREMLREYMAQRNNHDVPGQGEADVVSLANVIEALLVAIDEAEAEGRDA